MPEFAGGASYGDLVSSGNRAWPPVLGLACAGVAALGLFNVGLRTLQNYLMGVSPEDGWWFLPGVAQSLVLAVGLGAGILLAARGRDAGRQICVWLCCAAVPYLVVLLRTVPPAGEWNLRTGLTIVIVGTFVAVPAAVAAVAVLTTAAGRGGPTAVADGRGAPSARAGRWVGVGTVFGLTGTVSLGVLIAFADTVLSGSRVLATLTPYTSLASPAVGVVVLWLVPVAGVVLPAMLVGVGGVVTRRRHRVGRVVARAGGVLAAAGLTGVVTLTSAVVSNQAGSLPWWSVVTLAVCGLLALTAGAAATLVGLIGLDPGPSPDGAVGR